MREFLKAVNQTGIPKFFWYVMALVAAALAWSLVSSINHAQSFAFELASAKVQFSAREIDHNAQQLEQQLTTISEAATRPAVPPLRVGTTLPAFTPPVVPTISKVEIDDKLKAVKDIRENLKNIAQQSPIQKD